MWCIYLFINPATIKDLFVYHIAASSWLATLWINRHIRLGEGMPFYIKENNKKSTYHS